MAIAGKASVPSPKNSVPATYNEPTIMWRLRHRDGRGAHAVIGLRRQEAAGIWFIDGKIQNVYDFETWTAAINWAEQHRLILERGGWQLVE